MPASASAFCWASAPASVIGAIAPASVNGVTHVTWLRDAISMMPCDIGTSSVSGELVLTIVNTLGSRSSVGVVDRRAIAHHLDQVAVALPAEASRLCRTLSVSVRTSSAGLEVADRRVEVDRLDRVAADEVDGLEVLAQLEQVVEAGSVARGGARRRGRRVGRAARRSRRRGESPPMCREWAGFHECSWNSLGHVATRSSTIAGSKRTRCTVDLGAGVMQEVARLRVEEVHADVGEHPQRSRVDRFQLVGRYDLGRAVAHPRLGEGTLRGQA